MSKRPILLEDPEAISDDSPLDLKPEYSGFESAGATIVLNAYDNLVPAALRFGEKLISDQDDSKLVPLEEINKRYPDLNGHFDEPVKESYLDTMADRERFRKVLREVSENGPDSIVHKAGNLTVGLLSGFVDPLAIASGVGIAKGLSAAGKAVPAVSKILGLTSTPNLLSKVRYGMAEGVLGSAVEQPVVLAASAADKGGYTAQDAALNVVMSGFLGGALSSLGHGITKIQESGVRRAEAVKVERRSQRLKNSDTIKEKLLLAEAQMKSGKEVNVGHLDQVDVDRKSNFDFEHKKFDPKVDFAGKKFYVPQTKDFSNINIEATTNVLDDFGPGIYATDDLDVANGHSYDGNEKIRGSVHEVQFKEAPEVLDLDLPVPRETIPDIQKFAQDNNIEIKDIETKTGKEVLREISRVDLLPLRQKLSEKYDAMIHSGGEMDGQKYSNSNVITILKEDKLAPSKYLGPTDLNKLKGFKDADIQSARSLTEGPDANPIDPVDYDNFKNKEWAEVRDPKIAELETKIGENDEALKTAKDLGYLSEKDLKDLADDVELKTMEVQKTAYKYLESCLVK